MAKRHSVKLEFGALSDPLYKQLGLPRQRLRYLQDCADAVVNLRVGGFISPAIADRTRGRIYIRILKTFGKELGAFQDDKSVSMMKDPQARSNDRLSRLYS